MKNIGTRNLLKKGIALSLRRSAASANCWLELARRPGTYLLSGSQNLQRNNLFCFFVINFALSLFDKFVNPALFKEFAIPIEGVS